MEGCLKRRAPGFGQLGEKAAFCLPAVGRRTQLFHLIFTQPGAYLLEHPCKAHEFTHNFTNNVSSGGGRNSQFATDKRGGYQISPKFSWHHLLNGTLRSATCRKYSCNRHQTFPSILSHCQSLVKLVKMSTERTKQGIGTQVCKNPNPQ